MSDYDCENEASIGRPKRSIYLSDDSDDSFNLLFNVLVAQTETNEIDNEFN